MRAPRSPELVGREAELAELGDALASAAGGQGTVRLLWGEPGIGKTRLADEVSDRLRTAGFEVAWGRSWEAGGAPPLWPWSEALGAFGVAEALAGADAGEAARFRAFGAVREALRSRSLARPLLVVLDDLHAADETTLDLLLFVARGLRGSRVALLGTAREAEARRAPAVEARLARVAREGRQLALAPLAAPDVARLARCAAPGLAATQVTRVVEAAEGNPLFADELARFLWQRGDATDSALPEGVRHVVRSRLDHLPTEARRALEAASVLGRAFDRSALEALGADETGGAVGEALACAAEAAGLVSPVPGTPGRWAFSHALVRDAIYLSLPLGRRVALHHAHSLHLEALPGAADAERAHHALLGLPAGPAGRAVELARRAAACAEAMGAYAEAAGLLARALAALGPTRDPALRCDLGVALAEAEARAGLGERSRETAGRAADLARALGDPARLARAVIALGFTTTLGAVSHALVRALREALEALGDRDDRLAAQLTARLASALQPAPAPEEPIALAHRAVALARRAGDPRTLLATLYAACSALGDLAAPEVRAPLDAECAALAEALGDLAIEQRARARLALDRIELGELPAADAAIGEAEALGERLQLPAYRWRPLLLRSMRALMGGRFEESARLVAQAEVHAHEDGGFDAQVALALHLLATGLLRGEVTDAVAARVAAVTARLAYGAEYGALVELAGTARLGRVERARALAPVAQRLAGTAGLVPASDLQFASTLAEALAATGSPTGCAALLERLAGEGDREVTWGMMGLADMGPLSGPLALLAAAAGRAEEASGWFDRALRRCAERGLAPIEASLLAERATLLGWMGRVDGARADRDRAAALAGALGLAPTRILATREALGLSRLAAPAPPPMPPPTPAPAPPALTREGDVWAVRHGAAAFRVRHVRGLEMLATLLAHPDQPYPAVELDLTGEGARLAAGAGGAGELLDARARDAYRRRAVELEADLTEAEGRSDLGRAARVREELDALGEELARGVGLGGRARHAGSRAERSRVNVQRRLKDAIHRLAEHDPALGRHLERSVRTGTFCVYAP